MHQHIWKERPDPGPVPNEIIGQVMQVRETISYPHADAETQISLALELNLKGAEGGGAEKLIGQPQSWSSVMVAVCLKLGRALTCHHFLL